MPLALACELCPLVLQVPEGAKITTLPLCPSCAEGTMVVVEVVVEAEEEPGAAPPSEPPSFEFLPQPIAADAVDGFIDGFVTLQGGDDDDSKMLSSMINRITPVVLATQVIADLKNSGAEIDEASVIERFGEVGKQYRKELQKLEDQEGIGRGLRLSDGFPKDTDDHLRRWTRLFIGGDPNDGRIHESGLAQQLGLMTVKEGNGEPLVGLTDQSKTFLPIDLHRSPEIDFVTISTGGKETRLPIWIDPRHVDSILGFITVVAEAEMRWMKDVLGQTEGHVAVDTSEICDREIMAVMEGRNRSSGRWLDRSGESVLERSKREGESEGLDDEALSDHVRKALDSKIRPSVISTLGRLKELGLVFPFKRGRSTVYKATPEGKKWIREWDKY